MSLAAAINAGFQTKVASAEGREKLGQRAGEYIRDRLRELSFCTKIVPEVPVTKADCQVSEKHDTLVKVVYLEPQSKAYAIGFRGNQRARLIRAPRMLVGFYTIASEMFQKNEQELLAYDMPLTRIIEDNSVKDMQEVRDREWLVHVEAACQATQQEANSGAVTSLNYATLNAGTVVEFSVRKGELARTSGTNNATVLPVQRPDIVNLFKMLDTNRFASRTLLMTEADCDDLLQWTAEDFGNRLQSETAIEGFKHPTLLGKKVVRTVKTDILRPGNIYCFPDPEFIGHNFVLNNVKFYIDKIANLITWQAWMDVGMCIANVAAPRKMETYSGDATSLDVNSILSRVSPVAESALGSVNNRVDQNVKFPNISAF